MSAQFVDALLGYEYFLQNRGKITIDEINQYLTSHQRNPIQLRTYTHFNKLLENGFRSYIPINKFDVFQSLGKIQMAADRRRYSREMVKIAAKISRNGQKWTEGTIINRSLVGFGILAKQRFPVSTDVQAWIRLQGYEDIPVIVVWRKHHEEATRLGVRSLEFIGKYKISDTKIELTRLKGTLIITRQEGGDLRWDNLFRILSKSDEFINSLTDLIYSVDEHVGADVRLASPILGLIRFGSPGEVQVKVDFGIAELARMVIEKLQFWGLEKKKYLAEIRKLDLENERSGLENKKLALETDQLTIDLLRNVINYRKELQEFGLTESIVDEVRNYLTGLFGLNQLPKGIFDTDSLEFAILKERVLPAAAELIGGDDSAFGVNVSTEKMSEDA